MTFSEAFTPAGRRGGKIGAKTVGAITTAWEGLGVRLTITPRTLVANASFYCSSNARISYTGCPATKFGDFLDVVVRGEADDDLLRDIGRMVAGADTRSVVVRRHGEPLQRPA